MTFRFCVYKNCENYINLKDKSHNNVSMFGFPKNPERRQKWIELGQVSPNIPDTSYYFCSDHFDRKYFCIHTRRTILVGDAVPFPSVEVEYLDPNEEVDDELDSYLFELNECGDRDQNQVILENQDVLVSTTMIGEPKDSNDGHVFHNVNDLIVHKEYEYENRSNKRKSDDEEQKNKIFKTASNKALRHLSESANEENSRVTHDKSTTINLTYHASASRKIKSDHDIDLDHLVDTQYVTTFIFKGEEYVQMSKEHYVNEKLEAMKKLQKMENALKAIKDHLSILDV